jgi:hypothetical protein
MRQTATALALQSQHMDRLQDSIESGNATLIGHIANLSLSGTESADGPFARQTPTSAFDKDSDALGGRSTKRTKSRTYRMRLPNWLTDCVWEIAVHFSANVWTAKVYTVKIRPVHSLVFDAVRSGNLKVVRELLASGTLSLRDRAHMWNGSDISLLEASFWMFGTYLSIGLHCIDGSQTLQP